jgi:hypothetical protein
MADTAVILSNDTTVRFDRCRVVINEDYGVTWGYQTWIDGPLAHGTVVVPITRISKGWEVYRPSIPVTSLRAECRLGDAVRSAEWRP